MQLKKIITIAVPIIILVVILAYAFLRDGKEMATSSALNLTEIGIEYDNAYSPMEIGGKLAFIAEREDKRFIAYNNQEIGGDYWLMSNPVDVAGKLAFKAQKKKGDKFYIVYDGQEYGQEYDFIQYGPADINGQAAYLANIGREYFLVINGSKNGSNYSDVGNLVINNVINNEYAFYAKLLPKNGSNNVSNFSEGTSAYVARQYGRDVIVYNGEELGKEYDSVFQPQFVGGKLLYLAKKNNKILVIYNRERIGQEYDYVVNFTDINGRLAFIARQGSETFIDFDGEKIFIDKPQGLASINGKLAYISVQDDGFHMIYDGKEMGVYDYIKKIIELHGKLAFTAKIDNRWALIYDNGQQKISGFDFIDDLMIISGKLAFTAGIETKTFIMMEE
jgi:hypothetical protein